MAEMSRREFLKKSAIGTAASSVMVGIKDQKIMAVRGNPASSVNQGTLCVKGYSLPFIQYASDRLDMACHEAGISFSEGHTATRPHKQNEYTGVISETVLGIRRNCLQRHLVQSDEEAPILQME